ncbi:MAG: amidohydrolase family protein [Chloroflexota bacterium]
MIIDAHLHCSGSESTRDVLRALDAADIDVAVLLAPFVTAPFALADRESLCAANAHLARLVRGHTDRLVGFAVVNPLHDQAAEDLEDAVVRLGLRGLKLVPSGWYPYDACAHKVYAAAAALKIPILFHSGIFIDGRSGRFCQPVFYEAVRDYPGLRVALAHLGWPWTDEANAIGLIDLLNGVEPEASQFRFDLSFGPPPIYRRAVIERALAVLGPGLLQFGSDRFLPCHGEHIHSALDELCAILDEIGVNPAAREQVLGGTAAAWLGLTPMPGRRITQ